MRSEKLNTVSDELWSKIDEAHAALDNYLIVDEPSSETNRKVCAIYFSGNGIFFPKTDENFEQTILKRNRFEWYGTRVRRASRHIFMRDLKMCWYQEGINARINSIDKMADFLREKTRGYSTVCVGSSAGGYAALLFSSLLESECCFAFSPCLDVARCVCLHRGLIGRSEYWHERYYGYLSPHRKYNNLSDVLAKPGCVRYVCSPMQSVIDRPEYAALRGLSGFRFLRINSPVHGVGFPREVAERIFNLGQEELFALYDDSRNWDLLPLIWRYSDRRNFSTAVKLAVDDLAGRKRPFLRKRFYANLFSILMGTRSD